MIKNVVFDFGQVLVRFSGDYIASSYIKDETERAELVSELFDRRYWARLDSGEPEREVVEDICKNLPAKYHAAAREIFDNWYYHLPEIDGMRELIGYLRDNYDVGVYVLSNISKGFADHAGNIPILSLADGCVFSATCGCVKPSKEIYAHLCDKFKIKPYECVFIDDSSLNIKGAEDFGITTYLFDGDVSKLKSFLNGILKESF